MVEYHFPGAVLLDDVVAVTDEHVQGWALKFGQVELVLLGAGPPCQGVSGLNASRRGALHDERSCLFVHVDRIKALLQMHFPWCPTHVIMESVSSMDSSDKDVMSNSFGDEPWEINSEYMTWCRRPRLYWISWGLETHEGVEIQESPRQVHLTAEVPLENFLSPGWTKVDPDRAFPTFTTSETLKRWEEDKFRYPPYQYLPVNCVVNRQGALRLPTVEEKELMMGLPLGYTNPCLPKSQRKGVAHLGLRHSLVGNAWNVPGGWVVASTAAGPIGTSGNCDASATYGSFGSVKDFGCHVKAHSSSSSTRGWNHVRAVAFQPSGAIAFSVGKREGGRYTPDLYL